MGFYYSQTQSNPGNEESATNSPVIEEMEGNLGYIVNTQMPFIVKTTPPSPSIDHQAMGYHDETELDQDIDNKLMNENFRSLSSV